MATTILTTNLNAVLLSTASDATFLVPEGTIRNSNTDDAIQIGDGITSVANVTLWVDGAVYGNDDGIVTDTANNVAIHVGSTGVVRASSTDNIGANGIELGFSSNIFIANAGQISGDFAIAAQAGADTTILNSGLLTGVSKGVEMGIGGFLDNSGEIRGGTERGVDIRGDGTVVNSGLIAGQTDGIFAITSVALTNNATGVIRGQSGVFADSGDIVNHGEIASTGNGFAVDLLDDLNPTANTLTNTGQISGDVGLGTGADLLNNSGVITGDVFLEDGDDTYEGLASGVVNGKVFGMGGADTMLGGDARDDLDGGSSSDEIRGAGGDDRLRGRSGDDTVFGNDGDDSLIGDEGDDIMSGGRGNDTLNGVSDADILRGNQGDDDLIGGTGRDVLFGGEGEDTFIYLNTAHSLTGGANRDAIRDFTQGEDVIDLEAIAGGALSFRGSDPFTGTGAEFRAVTTAAGSTVVRVDEDGDGVRDMEILVQFTASMTVEDFIF